MFKYCCNVYLLYFKIVLLYNRYLGQVALVKEILNLNETSWLNKGKIKKIQFVISKIIFIRHYPPPIIMFSDVLFN